MKLVQKIDQWFNRLEGGLLIFLLSIMVILAFLQVALRNLFSTGIPWGDILLRQIVLWLGFLGGTLATSKERHIHIDAFAHFMSPRVKAAVRIFTNLFGAVVCLILAQAAVRFVQSEIEANTMMFKQIPVWYAEVIIPFGFGLHAIHFLIRSSLSASEALQKESVE